MYVVYTVSLTLPPMEDCKEIRYILFFIQTPILQAFSSFVEFWVGAVEVGGGGEGVRVQRLRGLGHWSRILRLKFTGPCQQLMGYFVHLHKPLLVPSPERLWDDPALRG